MRPTADEIHHGEREDLRGGESDEDPGETPAGGSLSQTTEPARTASRCRQLGGREIAEGRHRPGEPGARRAHLEMGGDEALIDRGRNAVGGRGEVLHHPVTGHSPL